MVDERPQEEQEPCYVISVAAKLVSLHPQTLRYYDRVGLIRPSRTSGRMRLYSQRDIDILRKIARLTEDLGVNLAGVEVVLNMSMRIEELQEKLATLQKQSAAEIYALRQRLQELEGKEMRKKDEYGIIRIVPKIMEQNPESGSSSSE
jgi:MerR family transcriptional regulator, heat shock protein HspR